MNFWLKIFLIKNIKSRWQMFPSITQNRTQRQDQSNNQGQKLPTTNPTTFVQRQKSRFPPYVNFFRAFPTFTRQICSKKSKMLQFIWRKRRLVTLLSALSLMYSVTNISFLCVHQFRFGLLSYNFGYIWKVVHF